MWVSGRVVDCIFLPWPDKKLLPKTSPAKLAQNSTTSTTKWPILPKNELQTNLRYVCIWQRTENLVMDITCTRMGCPLTSCPLIWLRVVSASELDWNSTRPQRWITPFFIAIWNETLWNHWNGHMIWTGVNPTNLCFLCFSDFCC